MGLLAPLFLAGLAALSLPLIFHLVRRTPRGRQEFSSLMFLSPSPPRLTRRSRLDQILLLLLRLAALGVLALAFARPFLRESAMLSLSDLPRRRMAILVDNSASMRRADLWRQAIAQAERELDELAPHDDVALFTFSDHLETVVAFPSELLLSYESSVDVVRQRLRSLQPTWGTTDLGSALTTLAGELDASSDVQQSLAEPQIVVISDFQKGSRIEALQAFEWPERVRIVTRPILAKRTTNAYAQLIASEEDAPDAELRVRIVNAVDSTGDQFFVSWRAGDVNPPVNRDTKQTTSSSNDATAVYVPPGQSRVVKLPRPQDNLLADRIVLGGDDHDFDNTHYVVPPRKQEATLLYAGADAADDPQGLQYYLRLAVSGDPLREVKLNLLEGDDFPASRGRESPGLPQLVLASRKLSTALQTALKSYAEAGGMVVLAPADHEAAEALAYFFDDVDLVGVPPSGGDEEPAEAGTPTERSGSQFYLLGEIDFTHALFAPFANPSYSDFTKIHFWNHLPVIVRKPATTQVVARLDNGDPWLLERTLGQGRVLALTSSWRPDDSQLAVSSKFVPLIGSLLDQACGAARPMAGVVVNEDVALPEGRRAPLVVRLPDGREVNIAADAETFGQTDQPGIYHAGSSSRSRLPDGTLGNEEGPARQAGPTGLDELRFAVNLAASESDTAPLDMEQLEQLGVRLGTDLSRAERLSRIRQQRDTELESRQKVWRWLLVGCLGLLIVETWWAGRAARSASQAMEAVG